MTMMSRRSALLVIVATAVALAGCQSAGGTGSPSSGSPGSGSPGTGVSTAPSAPADSQAGGGLAVLSADEILTRAKSALKGAKSFRAAGTIIEDGQRIKLDLRRNGTDFLGTLSMGKATVGLLSVDGRQYIRPNEQFWALLGDPKQAHTIAKLTGDKWVKASAKDKSLADLFDAADTEGLLQPEGTVTKGETKTIDGVPTIGLVDHGTGGGTLYIATVGEPYPIRIEPKVAGDGQLAFSRYGADFPEIKAPAAGDVLDLDAVKKR